MASLKDIATSLNVSIPLVSKVLSGRMGTTGCSEANRLSILAKAEEMGFKPNLVARALRTGRTGSIGVFIHPLGAAGSNLVERMLVGLSNQANLCEQRLCLSFYETDNDFLQRFAKTARAEIDGLIVAGINHPRLVRLYKAIEKNGIPVVTMVEESPTAPGLVNVYCDELQLGYMPTTHLLEQGCRNVAHIHSRGIRYEGYRKALQDHGVPENPALVYTAIGKFDAETGKEAAQHWITNKIQLDGLVAESDHQAFGAVTEFLKQGVRVPEDVKVFGVDDSPICPLSPVPLSSISQQVEEIGIQAVKLLMKRINQESVELQTIQPVLQLRASTGN
jgi:LacI family transcriptional regulator